MSDQFQPDTTEPFQTNPFDPAPSVSLDRPTLPSWLVRRLLDDDEQITWVRGPRWNPSWERYVTHPGLFVAALAIGMVCLAAGRLLAGSWADLHPAVVVLSGGLFFGSVIVLAFFNGFFTRLVVTTARVVILQGYEIRRTWGLDDLPRSLVRFSRLPSGEESRSIDLNAVKTLFGTSDQFVEAKTIWAFSKQLNRSRERENDRPDQDRTLPLD